MHPTRSLRPGCPWVCLCFHPQSATKTPFKAFQTQSYTAFMARQNRNSSLCKRTSENKYKTPRFMAPVQEIHSKESVQFPFWWSIEARLRHRRVQTLFQKAQTFSPDWGLTCSLLGSISPNLSPYPTSRDSRVWKPDSTHTMKVDLDTMSRHARWDCCHLWIPWASCRHTQ